MPRPRNDNGKARRRAISADDMRTEIGLQRAITAATDQIEHEPDRRRARAALSGLRRRRVTPAG